MSLPKLIVILGPTAAGKTDLAIKLATKFNGAIVSADSRQVYAELNIGTAKSASGRRGRYLKEKVFWVNGVPIFLTDIIKANQSYSAAQFQKAAIAIIKKIHNAKKTPFLVGGTGLYIQSVVANLDFASAPTQRRLRVKIENQLKKMGLQYLVKQLKKIDRGAYEKIDHQNPRRVIRALEVAMLNINSISNQTQKREPVYNILILGLNPNRPKLNQKINNRVAQMIAAGLEDEVKTAGKKYGWDAPGISALGYRQFQPYFEGRASLAEIVQEIQKKTRHYAKRQMTWFRNQVKNVHWINGEGEARRRIKEFLM